MAEPLSTLGAGGQPDAATAQYLALLDKAKVNPYPPGSEEWQFFEDSKAKAPAQEGWWHHPIDAAVNVGKGLARDVPRGVNWFLEQAKKPEAEAQTDTRKVLGGVAKGIYDVPEDFAKSLERYRAGGAYEPGPALNAAMLGTSGGLLGGTGKEVGTVLTAGARRRPLPPPSVLEANPRAVIGGNMPPEDLESWFGKSKVTTPEGKPLTVYRGEHGEPVEGQPFQSKLGSLSFGNQEAANLYAMDPNDSRMIAQASRVMPGQLKIENPIINNPSDPFIGLDHLEKELGTKEAQRIAEKFDQDIQHTNNWDENYRAKYDNVADLLKQNPGELKNLYFDTYKYLDDPAEVAKLKNKGYDGAIHVGSGDTAGDLEYRIFDPKQFRSSFGQSPGGKPPISGSFNPLDETPVTFNSKEPHQFTPQDWEQFGKHYGVDNMGPLSKPVTYTDQTGKPFELPGGTEGKWTYADLLSMKANPINPANVDRELHTEMQKKLGRTMTPGKLSDADVWNGLVFGMTSPNNPLFPNQLSASRLRLRSPEMLDDLASMIPWKPGEEVPAATRKAVSDNIASRFGLQAGEKGGLGVRGSADYSRVGELAQMFKQDPKFFRKAPGEDWGQAVERISSQVPGLSMKTGSFGTVWQDPATAAISAIDRHMARKLEETGGLFADAKERTAWENQSVQRWNNRTETVGKGKDKTKVLVNKDDQAKDFNDLLAKRGSDGFIGEMLLDHVGDALEPKFRMAKGNINPNIPPHLAQANWVREPDTVFKMGAAYKRALALNQKIADEHGLNLFMSQWMEWDRIRNRFEPHENMFPGLSKVPAMSMDQLRAVDEAHKITGHKTYGKTEEGALQPTRPYPGPLSQLGYLGVAGLGAAPLLGGRNAPAD